MPHIATCHGCDHVHFTATFGQLPDKPQPFVRCAALNRDIPMVMGDHHKYLGNEVPEDCPELEQAKIGHRWTNRRKP